MYQEFRPERRLLALIECGWARSGSPHASTRVLPDGCMDLFVTSDGEVLIAGPATTSYQLPAGPGGPLAGLRLRPGAAAAVLGRPADEFRDDRVPLVSALGPAGRRIAETLCDTTSPEQRLTRLQSALATYFADAEPVVDRPVARAVQVLRRRPDQPVSAVADEVGLSERQLRRRFDAAVGYGPKRLGRVFRFQRLLDLIHATDPATGWAELAVAAGYADQSHMINECQALAGTAPTALPAGDVSVSSNTDEASSA
ncbi:helix-turn-helix domain-containing protein [Mycobacterium talmoniae]|uniref:AraC family transcriptional regulator n=1 Tax=Mycobacterium talmoniae TaxID=1858794 RepID=A0A1S1NJE3_9MYCO|nr:MULTISPECIES: AraC family transcriptional regulator [Mycobacterium]OHV04187.1 AraC family transcriptional regulator [Mycobacterium talmoniae]TDH56244.1 AraC family transcriptional regulator [Mycobacterium eburneum]